MAKSGENRSPSPSISEEGSEGSKRRKKLFHSLQIRFNILLFYRQGINIILTKLPDTTKIDFGRYRYMPIIMQNLSTLEGISLMHGTVPVYLFREWSYNATVKGYKARLTRRWTWFRFYRCPFYLFNVIKTMLNYIGD